MSEWNFFDIGFKTFNLFSFMMGMTYAFFNQGLFGKRIGQWIFLYFAGLAGFYALQLYVSNQTNSKYVQTQQLPDPNSKLNAGDQNEKVPVPKPER